MRHHCLNNLLSSLLPADGNLVPETKHKGTPSPTQPASLSTPAPYLQPAPSSILLYVSILASSPGVFGFSLRGQSVGVDAVWIPFFPLSFLL